MRKKNKIQQQDTIAYLFILPNYLIYFVFILIPIFIVVFLGFTDYELVKPPAFIGLQNFLKLFTDQDFLKALKNTFIYWIATVFVSMISGLLLAILLNKPVRGRGFFRAAYYLPNVLSLVSVSIMWLWMYDPAKGVFNTILRAIGLPTSDWLLDPSIALFSVIVPNIWAMLGFNMVIYLAGLQGIPDQYYEAARIDGASDIKQFFKITVPMLRTVSFFIFVVSTIKSFMVFDQIYVMTRGGPVKSTTTIAFEVYENGFQYFKMGYAAAMSFILLLIVALITFVNFTYGKEGYGGEMT